MNTTLHWLLESGWQASLILVVVSLVLLVGRRWIPAGWRYAMLLLVIVRFLLPDLPRSEWSAYRVVPATPAQAWQQAWPGQPVPAGLSPQTLPPLEPAARTAKRGLDYEQIIFTAWLAVTALLALWLVCRQIGFELRLRRAGRPATERLAQLSGAVARRAGLRRTPPTYLIRGLDSPAICGFFRPCLVLPADIEQSLDGEKLKLALLHECMHLRRGDQWTHAASLIAWTLHWWNPLAWWLMARLRTERELATDAAVLSLLSADQQADYGDTLLNFARRQASTPSWQPTIGILERPSGLRQRIAQIGHFSRTPVGLSVLSGLLVLSMAAVLLARQPATKLPPLPTTTQERERAFSQFMKAVRAGDVAKVQIDLDRGIDINGGSRTTPLFNAVDQQDLKMVKFLLAHGAQTDVPNTNWESPLNRACLYGNKPIIDMLLAAGAKVDNPMLLATTTGDLPALEKRQAETPFTPKELKDLAWKAVTSRQRATFDWLWTRLQSEPEKERQRLLNSWLSEAARWGAFPMMEPLIKLGADVQKIGPKALNSAVQRNHLQEVRLLLELGVSPQMQKGDYRSLLGDAAGNGDMELVKLLVDHGASLDDQDGQGLTALSWAAYCRRQDVCNFLLDRGARIDLKDQRGGTALSHAAFAGNAPDIVERLLKMGANPRETDSSGAPLLLSMQNFVPPRANETAFPGIVHDSETAKAQLARTARVTTLLLEAGADPNAGDPLGNALTYDHPEIARTLIAHGADLSARSKDNGLDPLSSTFMGGWDMSVDLDLVQLLLDKGVDPNASTVSPNITPPPAPLRPLNYAAILASRQINSPDKLKITRQAIDLFIQRGARFNTKDTKGAEWLQAAMQGDGKHMRDLRKAGVDVNTRDLAGWSALTLALAFQQVEVANWLLDEGAKPNLAVTPGEPLPAQVPSALDLAVNLDDSALVDRLIAAGATPDASALLSAARLNDITILQRLLAQGGDASQIKNLFVLVQEGHPQGLKILLANGAKADFRWNSENRENVYWAVYYDQIECLKPLLEYGADPTIKDAYGETPLSYAQKFRKDMVPLLETAIQKWNETHPTSEAPKTEPAPKPQA